MGKRNKDSATVGIALDYCMGAMRLSPSTLKGFRDTRKKLQAHGLLSVRLDKLTGAMVRRFLNELEGDGLMQSTVCVHYTKLVRAVTHYIREHDLPIAPRITGLMKTPPPSDRQEIFLTFSQIKELAELEIPEGRISRSRDLWMIMALTGMAIADLVRFEPSWISRDRKWLSYKRKKIRNGGSCDVPLAFPLLFDLVDRYSWPIGLSIRAIQYGCAELATFTGRPLSPHVARHSFGVIMIEMGFSMESVSKMMGHASIATTERVYARITRDKIERELNSMPKEARLTL